MRKSVWTVVFLVGFYVICQAVADVGATKLVQVGPVAMPAGTFVFALTFTIRDLLHKRLGKEWARAAIVAAGAFNLFQAFYLKAVATLPSPPYYTLSEPWGAIFSIVPSVTLASIIAEVCSELVDTEVYHAWTRSLPRLPQWTAVLVSNGLSLPLDSFLFGTLAFTLLPPLFSASPLPLPSALALVQGQIVWKAAVTLVSMPTIYLVRRRAVPLAVSESA